jgi:succinyl-diaminopimelate desuccinylase
MKTARPLLATLGLLVLWETPLAAKQPAATVRTLFRDSYSQRLVPLLSEAIRFPTVSADTEAASRQRAWLARVATDLGLTFRDAGPVAEVELLGPPGAPVLGLVAHADVVVPGDGWTVPPFEPTLRDGYLYGRGVVDDKAAIVQALLAMAALQQSGVPRTQTVRLLVGSDEEAGSHDVVTYQQDHKAPDLSLVIDSTFPVVVGEMAWNALTATAADPFSVRPTEGAAPRWALTRLDAGTATSIVPGRATATLRWLPESLDGFKEAAASLAAPSTAADRTFAVTTEGREATLTVTGKAAHAGMSIEAGRNALVPLAERLLAHVAASGARDLLAFAALSGQDLHGTSLGLTADDPLWGRSVVNVATIKPGTDGALVLSINVRVPPPLIGDELQRQLYAHLAEFNRASSATLAAGGYFGSKPLVMDPQARIVKRLLAAYERGTGERGRPVVAAGASYAGRLPNAIPFGMWFPGTPYPGHDVDERIAVRDLHRGVDVLIETLVDLACSPPLARPLEK